MVLVYAYRIKDKVLKLIEQELDWPKDLLIPEDVCAVLFFRPGLECASGSAVVALENEFDVELDELTKDSPMVLLDLVNMCQE
jgi:hypothetical protein